MYEVNMLIYQDGGFHKKMILKTDLLLLIRIELDFGLEMELFMVLKYRNY